ncbi:TonB-dependent receptor [Flavobacteriaceae bacterium]|nr:TonB-dependent receptor [Flavobacteriaceae bacterium]
MFNSKLLYALIVFACFYGHSAHAQKSEQLEEVLINGKTFAQKKNVEGKIIDKIDSIGLKAFQGQSLSNALNSLSGVYIGGANSKTGSPKSIYIRGGANKQVLILIDGIPVNDASSIDTSLDLNLIPLENVQEIELMKGASSTLYGSGAAVAVLNIITKKSDLKPITVSFNTALKTEQVAAENNSFNRWDNNLHVSGKLGSTDYSVQSSFISTDGISEAYDELDEGFESDSYSALSTNVKIGQRLNNKLRFDAFYSFQKNDQDYDNGAFYDGLENTSLSRWNRVGLIPEYSYGKGAIKWQNSWSKIDRQLTTENTWAGGVDDYRYLTESFKSDIFNQIQLAKGFSNITGSSFEYQNTRNYGPYEAVQGELYQFRIFDAYTAFTYQMEMGLTLDAGLRYNYHNVYDSNWTYDFGANYSIFEKSKLLASYSTAYITPSLYQLFSQYGNTELTPEESSSWEVGFEFQEIKGIQLSLTYFNRSDFNPIIFYTDPDTFASYYINDNNAQYDFNGFEFDSSFNFGGNLSFGLSYTHTNLDEDKSNYTPKDVLRLQSSYLMGKSRFSLIYQYNGERFVEDFRTWPAEILTLEDYNLIDLNYSYTFNNYLNLNFSVNNLLNEDYQERLGYSTLGRNFMLGLNVKL